MILKSAMKWKMGYIHLSAGFKNVETSFGNQPAPTVMPYKVFSSCKYTLITLGIADYLPVKPRTSSVVLQMDAHTTDDKIFIDYEPNLGR